MCTASKRQKARWVLPTGLIRSSSSSSSSHLKLNYARSADSSAKKPKKRGTRPRTVLIKMGRIVEPVRGDKSSSGPRCALYSSGAVMFYGKPGHKTWGMVSSSTSKRKSNKTNSPKTLGSVDPGTLVTTSTSRSFQTASQLGSPPNDVPPTLASMALAQTDSTATSGHDTLIANSATMLSLLAEVSNVFSNVPYVNVVAGVVKQIIEISNVFSFFFSFVFAHTSHSKSAPTGRGAKSCWKR